MGFRSPTTWVILILLIVVLFGASRLPDVTRNIGKSLKIFKEEVRDLSDDKADPTIDTPDRPTPAQESPNAPQPPRSEQPPSDPPGPENPPNAPHPGN